MCSLPRETGMPTSLGSSTKVNMDMPKSSTLLLTKCKFDLYGSPVSELMPLEPSASPNTFSMMSPLEAPAVTTGNICLHIGQDVI